MNPIKLKTILEKHLYRKENDITNLLYEGKTITIYNETKKVKIKFRRGKKTPIKDTKSLFIKKKIK